MSITNISTKSVRSDDWSCDFGKYKDNQPTSAKCYNLHTFEP